MMAATIKSSIVVPKSGCTKIKSKLTITPITPSNLYDCELSILAMNKTRIIFVNSEGWIKIGKPRGSRSYHLLTPNIGRVKSKPNKIEIERKNKELIKLYKFSIERYVVKKNTAIPINEKNICLVSILSVSN